MFNQSNFQTQPYLKIFKVSVDKLVSKACHPATFEDKAPTVALKPALEIRARAVESFITVHLIFL